LLETADDHVPLTGDEVGLARQVVSVESHGELIFLATITNGCVGYTEKFDFKPRSDDGCELHATSCWWLHAGNHCLLVPFPFAESLFSLVGNLKVFRWKLIYFVVPPVPY
jgi:hypothetical protein